MDELLKAYAAKRRKEINEPLEIHPATRQLLQGEVTRTFPETARTRSKFKLFQSFWPRLALAGSTLALLLVVGIFIFQPLSKFNESARVVTSGEQKDSKSATQAEHSKKSSDRSDSKIDRLIEARDKSAGIALGKTQASLPPDAITGGAVVQESPKGSPQAPLPTSELDRSVAQATPKENITAVEATAKEGYIQTESIENHLVDNKIEQNARGISGDSSTDEKTIVLNEKLPTLDRIKNGKGMPPAPITISEKNKAQKVAGAQKIDSPQIQPNITATAGSFASKQESVPLRLKFTKVDLPRKDLNQERTNDASALLPTTNILTIFHIELMGDEVRITDADGSIYMGSIEKKDIEKLEASKFRSEEEGSRAKEEKNASDREIPILGIKEKTTAPQTKKSLNLDPATSSKKLPSPNTIIISEPGQKTLLNQGFLFRVRGKNLTLNQEIEFQGNFVVEQKAGPIITNSNLIGTGGDRLGAGLGGNALGGDELKANDGKAKASPVHILGKVRVGNSHEVELDAVLTEP